jgi:hypothetical protein
VLVLAWFDDVLDDAVGSRTKGGDVVVGTEEVMMDPKGMLEVFVADEVGDGDGIAELLDDVDEADAGPPPPCTSNSCTGMVA